MKQILQDLKTGETELVEVPSPGPAPGRVLIRSHRSVISAGTERMLVDFGRAGLLEKARSQPDKVKQVMDKVTTDGLVSTLEAVRRKLDQPITMGYSNVGTVLEVGAGVDGLAPGDRVVSNGAHAEVVSVPKNLCAAVPDGVSDDEAAFTVIGAIALQGIRLAGPSLGEIVVVTGLGLIGLITVQLLRAHGCMVIGIDMDPGRLELARSFGAETVDLSAGEDPVAAAEVHSRGRGVDAVIIAAATDSSEPVRQAARMCRKRGRIILVGVAGLELSRDLFYEKELTFQVSCSYGPGRYDPSYEDKGQDYPLGFVRWTEQRNFEAVLDMMATGRLRMESLISHRFPLTRAPEAYDLITGGESCLGVLLDYPTPERESEETLRDSNVRLADTTDRAPRPDRVGMGFIGSGNFASGVLIPAFKDAGADLVSVASQGGVTGIHAARRHGFDETTTDAPSLFDHQGVDAIAIASRHDSHAEYVIQGLNAGKALYVEKPLALSLDELRAIDEAYRRTVASGRAPILHVGFNRRFAPLAKKVKTLLDGVAGPKALVMTVNAGVIPPDHWVHDPELGGGRIVGEACHFLDLLRFLVGEPIIAHDRITMDSPTRDTTTIQLGFSDGSIGTIHYFANGSSKVPKERLEVFAAGRVVRLDNFRYLRGFDWPGFRSKRLWRVDKGHGDSVRAFLGAVRDGGPAPLPFDELMEVSRLAIELAEEHSTVSKTGS